jgi:hypothetical protein
MQPVLMNTIRPNETLAGDKQENRGNADPSSQTGVRFLLSVRQKGEYRAGPGQFG